MYVYELDYFNRLTFKANELERILQEPNRMMSFKLKGQNRISNYSAIMQWNVMLYKRSYKLSVFAVCVSICIIIAFVGLIAILSKH